MKEPISIPPPDWPAAAEFDGGETGCGELLLDLFLYCKRQGPGATFRLRAHDPGAPQEIPAWCRLTGHELLKASPPYFLIKIN